MLLSLKECVLYMLPASFYYDIVVEFNKLLCPNMVVESLNPKPQNIMTPKTAEAGKVMTQLKIIFFIVALFILSGPLPMRLQ